MKYKRAYHAVWLFISTATANTQRRNMRNNWGLRNNDDTLKFAHAYNLLKT